MFISKPRRERAPLNLLRKAISGTGLFARQSVIFVFMSFTVPVLAATIASRGVGAIDRRLELLFAARPDSVAWVAASFLIWGVVAWLLSGYVARRLGKQDVETDHPDYEAPGFWRTLGNALYPVVATILFAAVSLQAAGLILEGGRVASETATSQFAYGTVQATVFEDSTAQCFLDLDNVPCSYYLRDDPKFNAVLGEPDARVISFGDLDGNDSQFVYVYALTGNILTGKFGDMNSVEDTP